MRPALDDSRRERAAILGAIDAALTDPVRLIGILLQVRRVVPGHRARVAEELRVLRADWGPPIEAQIRFTGRRSAVLSFDGTERVVPGRRCERRPGTDRGVRPRGGRRPAVAPGGRHDHRAPRRAHPHDVHAGPEQGSSSTPTIRSSQRLKGRERAWRGGPRSDRWGWALRGAAAGAAGTTALNVVAYLDMAVRGPGPQFQTTAEHRGRNWRGHAAPVDPGRRLTDGPARVEGLGALTGLVAGVGVGGLRAGPGPPGFRSRRVLLTTLTVLVSTRNGASDRRSCASRIPRPWSVVDWISDLVPRTAMSR